MKEKYRYLLVNAKDVVNYPRDEKGRKYNSYYRCDKPFISLNEMFENYNIPDEYRFVVIRMNPFFSKYECQEYLTEIPFDYTGYTRFKKNESKVIKGRAITGNYRNIIEFETPVAFVSEGEITRFLVEIIDNKMFDKYMLALNKLFSLQYTYDDIEQLNNYRRVKKQNN